MNFEFGEVDLKSQIGNQNLNCKMFAMTVLFIASGSQVACTKLWDHGMAYFHSRQGVLALETSDTTTAEQEFTRSLRYLPKETAPQINLGIVYRLKDRPDRAADAFRTGDVLAKTPDESFISRFDEGEAFGAAKKVDEALAAYQRALVLRPDSIETKTNIELLISQNGQGQGKGGGQGEQGQDQGDKGEGQDNKKEQKEDKPKEYAKNQKYKPRPFDGKDLGEADVKKILDELKRQENRIRAEYQKKESKETASGEDW